MQRESSEEKDLQSEEVLSNNQPKETKNETSSRYPRGIPFILMFKFGEMFTYNSFFVLLTWYIHSELNFNENFSATFFHIFMLIISVAPLFGAILADAYLAKFWTISYMAILFFIGITLIFIGSTLTDLVFMRTLSILGILLNALANGALKPSITSFGGDQFKDHQHRQRKRYFSLYFCVIYCSYILAAILSPFMRSQVKCFGKDNCYPLSFGTAMIVFFLGTVGFITGKQFYIIIAVQEEIFFKVFKCIGYALSRKIKEKKEKKDHWLDYAEDQFDKSLISDIKVLFHVFKLYIPLPVFVTLINQVGSTWVLQCSKMDREIFGYHIKPDQVVVLQPILMNIWIASFEFAIFPFLTKLGLLKSQLQKIGIAGFLNSLAFFMAGFVQLAIESDLPTEPKEGIGELVVINNSPCSINVAGTDNMRLKAFETDILKSLTLTQERRWKIAPTGCSAVETVNKTFNLETQFDSMMITLVKDTLEVLVRNDSRVKLKSGNPRICLFYRTEKENTSFIFQGPTSFIISTNNSKAGMTDYYGDMRQGKYIIYFQNNDSSSMRRLVGSSIFKDGGNYIIAIYASLRENESNLVVLTTLKWNSVHVVYQLPQFIAVSGAEVLFSVTGLVFVYAEAPVSLKAVAHACWMLVYGFGNALFLLLKPAIFLLKDSYQFFVFAVIMVLATIVFIVIAHFYTYINDENKKL